MWPPWWTSAVGARRSQFANSPEGMRKLQSLPGRARGRGGGRRRRERAGYGRLHVAALEPKGTRCLTCRPGAPVASDVGTGPAIPTRRRPRHRPGRAAQSRPLGPALEPELVRELRCSSSHAPDAGARPHPSDPLLAPLDADRPGRRGARGQPHAPARATPAQADQGFGNGLVEQVATRCIRDLARDIEDLNKRIAGLDAEIAQLLAEHGNPVADLHGAGPQIAAALIAHGAMSAASATPPPSPASAAPHQSPRLRPNRRPTPAPPRRQPPTQRRPLPHRDRPSPPPPTSPHIPRTQDRRRQNAA